MRKSLITLSMAALSFSLAAGMPACLIAAENTDNTNAETETRLIRDTDSTGEWQADGEDNEAAGFTFQELSNLDFIFASGAGAWSTSLHIDTDGSFSGEYHDSDMGDFGDGYPNGTMYLCVFYGQFTEPVQVNEYTWSVQISEIHYSNEVGTQEIIDDVRYCYSVPYGINDAEDILIYLPGAPLEQLPEEYRSWVGYYDLSSTDDTVLPFYGLYNKAQQQGFSSYTAAVSGLDALLADTESQAAILEASLENDPLSQSELNQKSLELYELWDGVLNSMWADLRAALDEETMNALTQEELIWIDEKEQAASDAGAEFEGGSMQPMLINLKAAELTKERVYELAQRYGDKLQ